MMKCGAAAYSLSRGEQAFVQLRKKESEPLVFMSQFVLHPEALAELHEIWKFIARDGPEAADRVAGEIHDAIRALVRSLNLPRALRFDFASNAISPCGTFCSLTQGMKSRSWFSRCFTVGAIHGYPQLSYALDRDSGSSTRRRRFDGDIDGAGSEGNQEKS
jgi:ParE toxin of type II toxin-antitoxin system, parDE